VPTYQYVCTACGEELEAVQSFTDAPLTECPVCGGALRKVFSAVGVVFKGSGFYKNDSRKSTSGGEKKSDGAKTDAAAKTDSGPKADGAKSDGAKSDGKAASPSTSGTPAAKSA
jgi:putative FmdB family regulatory protein